jgi:hypothetical protein
VIDLSTTGSWKCWEEWLRRFHGVASHYLPNYLGWRWAVDAERIGSPELLLRSAPRAPPT